MRRLSFWIVAVMGGLWACGHLLLAAAAISDAYYRCPGNQCSDAWTAGIYYTASVSIGLLLVLMSAARLRSRSFSSSGAELENGLR
jgi:hypothetical protein